MKKLFKFVVGGIFALMVPRVHGAVVVGPVSTLFVQDEGVTVSTNPTTLNFVGSGVTAAKVGTSSVTITISGGGGGGGLPLTPGDTNYIQNTNSLQSGSTFYVSSGTVNGKFQAGIIVSTQGKINNLSGTIFETTDAGTILRNTTATGIVFKTNSSKSATFIGDSAGSSFTNGDSLTYIGSSAGGFANGIFGGTFVGVNAGINSSTGADHGSFLGQNAGYGNTTGSDNTFIGYGAGYAGGGGLENTTGSQNVYIGINTYGNQNANNAVLIGVSAHSDCNNCAVIGNPSSTFSVGVGTTSPSKTLSVVGDSIVTGYANFPGTVTLSGNYPVQKITPISGQVLKFDGTNWKPDTDLNSGGGGGTTIWVKEDGSAVDNSVSTMNFTSGINTNSSPSGQVNVAVDYSTVASRGDVILKQNTLQSGASAYPDFIYNGSSASLKGVTLNDLTASLPIKTDANKKLTAAAIDVGSSEVTGTLAAGRFPALTGDVTTSAGSLTTTVIDDSHNHTVATSTFAVTGGTFTVTGGTTTFGGVTYKWPQAQASGTKILSNDGTGQLSWATDATSAGGGDNLGTHVATRTLDMAGFPIINVSSIGVNGSGGSFIDIGTNTAMGLVVNGATWYFNTSSITYSGSSSAVLGSNIIISSGGVGAISAATGLTGTLAAAQFPALTGDVTTTAGSLTTTVIDDSHNHTVATSTFAVTGGTFTVTGGTTTIGGVTYKWPQAQASGTKILSNDGTGQLSWATDATSAGGGDNLGNHIATMTLNMSGFGIINIASFSATTGTISGAGVLSENNTYTLTNKTFDAQGTGNVLAFLDTWQWNNADSLFSGTTYYTTTSTNPMYGHGTFAASNSTSTCGVYLIGNAGADFDTSTNLTLLLYDFTGGVDTSSRTYIVSIATYTTGMNLSTMTYGSPITVTISNFSVGGLNRRGVSASTTLTGWNSVLSANADFAVAVRRQGDSATLDVSTIDSYFGGAIITRGRRQ